MGTFQGHLLPGAFFVAFALWWTVQISKRAWICSRKSIPFYNSVTYNGMWGACLTWPVEGIIKVLFTGVGMALELLASTDYGHAGKIVFWGDVQHVTMYLFFLISGLCDIFCHLRLVCALPGLDYVASALAFGAEFILFKFHLHGRSELDVLVHTLLLYAVAACVIATLIEYKHPNSLLAGYTRAFFVLLQGTWFIQVGLILYPPLPTMRHWADDDHNQMMVATMMFAWHMAADVVLMMVIVAVSRHLYVRCCWIREGCQEYNMVGEEKSAPVTFSMSRASEQQYESLGNDDSTDDEAAQGQREEVEEVDDHQENVL